MLAKHVPTVLPPMPPDEAIETTRIHSVAGVLEGRGLVGTVRFAPRTTPLAMPN